MKNEAKAVMFCVDIESGAEKRYLMFVGEVARLEFHLSVDITQAELTLSVWSN